MATTKAPLFGLDASGTLAKAIVFSKWRGRTYVRRHAIPANPRSGLQIGMRAVFKYITQAFGALSTSKKAEWDALAAPDNITQLNAQVRDAQKRARLNLGWRIGPDESAGTTPDAPTNPTNVGSNQAATIGWTRPAGNKGDYCTVVYMAAGGDPFLQVQDLVGIVDVAVETMTITGLTNGTTYHWKVREMNTDGEFGAMLDGDTVTPTA